jgi:phosphate transport system substrate-binding protein
MRGAGPLLKWLAIPALMAACGGGQQTGEGDGTLSGQISIDGSSTVYPISEAVAEEFMIEQGGGVRVTVGLSGTGGGFKRFCAGETEISDASRPIKDSEKQICTQNQVDYLELPVAYDGLTVAVNPKNTFVECLTVAELKKIWEPGSTVQRWSDIRAGFPNQPVKLYGPGTASGTFDYFTEAIVGKEDASRADYTASEDDNVLVQGVEGDASALGYFGYAYYVENKARLKEVAVDGGAGCVHPTEETVKTGTYTPLSRPLFIYVKRSALERPEVRAFVEYYIENARNLVGSVGYVALDDANYQESLSKLGPGTSVEP